MKITNMNMKFRKYPVAGQFRRNQMRRYPTLLFEHVRCVADQSCCSAATMPGSSCAMHSPKNLIALLLLKCRVSGESAASEACSSDKVREHRSPERGQQWCSAAVGFSLSLLEDRGGDASLISLRKDLWVPLTSYWKISFWSFVDSHQRSYLHPPMGISY